MKMKQLLLCAFLFMAALLPVSADYIAVITDEFASNHECTEHDQYYTNTEEIEIYINPEHTDSYHKAPAGSYFLISKLYSDENNITWGNQGVEVWMRMDELTPVEYNEEIKVYIPQKESSQNHLLALVITACVLTGGITIILKKRK